MKDFPGHSLSEIGHVLLWVGGKREKREKTYISMSFTAGPRTEQPFSWVQLFKWCLSCGKIYFLIIENRTVDEI